MNVRDHGNLVWDDLLTSGAYPGPRLPAMGLRSAFAGGSMAGQRTGRYGGVSERVALTA